MVGRVISGGVAWVFLSLLVPTSALAAAPTNDDIANATPVTALPFADSVDTTDATTAQDDPDCVGNGPTAWYVYTPATDQQLLADTLGSDYDTTLSVYTGSPGSLTQIACNDDAVGVQSAVLFDAASGTTYFFMVGAFASGDGGNLTFSVDESDFQPTDVEVTIDGIAKFNSKTGSAYLSGTVTCTDGAVAFLDAGLEQRVGRRTVTGGGSTFVECDGTSQAWTVEVVGDNGLFKGGQARTLVFAEACGIFDCDADLEERSVALRR
jgi:hypothetical protein